MSAALRRIFVAMGLALLVCGTTRAALAYDPGAADRAVQDARHEGLDGFCADPPSIFRSPGTLRLCPLARQVPDCERLVLACDRLTAQPDPLHKWNLGWLGEVLAIFLRTAMWFLVAAVPLFLLWLVLDATIRARRDRQGPGKPNKPALVTPEPALRALAEMADAERFLALAAEHAERGQLDQAAALYLAASLAALDRRGAIRLARHRTNGEYVRACKESAAKPGLRAIVREVDRAHFGKEPPTPARLAEVAARAVSIVRAVAATAVMALLLLGCDQPVGGSAAGAQPDGDDLFLALLERQGVVAARPDHSLATLPIPTSGRHPVLVVNGARTPLEPDAQTHLVRWVRAGGTLFLFGGVESWPEDFGAKWKGATGADVKIRFLAGDDDADGDVDEDGYVSYAAHVARPAGLRWKTVSETFAFTGDGEDYAGVLALGKGYVVGLATDDLVTNVGIASPPNAQAVTAILARYAGPRALLVARPQDGVSPPSGPIAALVHAGLGLALVHAAFAAALLLLAYGVRQARAKDTPPPARRAWTEHVAATGTLYARAKLAPHALAAYAKFVDGRLRARMPRGMTDPAAFLALRSGQDAGHCAETWARAMASRAGDRVQGDELATLADLRALYAAAALKTE